MNNIGYIGTYTDEDSKGIYNFLFNESNGEISDITLAARIDNPTYLTINKEKNKLYSVAKSQDTDNIIQGGVACFDISKNYTLSLKQIDIDTKKPPCHVSLSNNKKNLFVSNYHDKHITTYTLDNNLNFTSKSINFHEGPAHIHFAIEVPDNNFVCVLDLGLDKLFVYELINNKLILNENLSLTFKSNCGPRHMVFSPCNKFAYILCELSSEIITLSYLGNGNFKVLNYISTIPKTFSEKNSTAAIRISNDGKFIFTSNRGHNSITSFKVNSDSTLTLIDFYTSFGLEPRDFNLTPNNTHLILGNHKSNNLTIYKISNSGTLTLINKDIKVPSPVCVQFLK